MWKIMTLALAVLVADAASASAYGGLPNGQDEAFAIAAVEGGLMKIELGRLASERAASAAVRDFGRRVAEDLGRAGGRLERAAAAAGIALPASVRDDQQQFLALLSRLADSEVDREFLARMIQDLREDVSGFEQEARLGNARPLRDFAREALPALRDHLRTAEGLAGELAVAAGTAGPVA